MKKKKPQLNRNSRIKEMLSNDFLNGAYEYIDTKMSKPISTDYTVADLFSGAGGMTLGFQMAGFRPIFSVELDPDGSATYKKNFPNSFHHEGLIEDLSDQDALMALRGQDIDVLCAGFPCQGFSVAGDRDPNDKRNILFRQFVRFANLFKPKVVVGENVAGVVTLDEGRFFHEILKSFEAIGYPNMTALLLEAADYGVPQLRSRVFFIASRFDTPNLFPAPILDSSNYVSIEDAIDDLIHVERDSSINHEWTSHSSEMEKRIARVLPGHSLYEKFVDAWKRQYKGTPSMTIKENHGGTHIHYELNRVLSAREMARLQSFPDSFIFSGRMKRVMFQVGNAVPPLLAKNVASAVSVMLERIETSEGNQSSVSAGMMIEPDWVS